MDYSGDDWILDTENSTEDVKIFIKQLVSLVSIHVFHKLRSCISSLPVYNILALCHNVFSTVCIPHFLHKIVKIYQMFFQQVVYVLCSARFFKLLHSDRFVFPLQYQNQSKKT